MKSDSLKKVIRAVKAGQDELTFQLREVTAQLNAIERNINQWNEHYYAVLEQISQEFKSNENTDNLVIYNHQTRSINSFVSSLNQQKEVLVKDFDKIAEKLKREQNKIKFLQEKLKKQVSEERKEKERNFELDIIELWEMNNQT